MKRTLVECIPNFSEGRDQSVIDAIVEAIQSVAGVFVLNYSSDVDHNRSVVTLVGEPQPVLEAVFRGIQTAARLINMDAHQGTHPRVGATDVVPFVPISSIGMEDCVQLAHALGRKVGSDLRIPVYLYANAAQRNDRVKLEDVRRGQFEALKNDIEINMHRRPDYGPSKLGSAGATIIGARNPLVAFNVFLSTTDVSAARRIARKVRHSSGGFPNVKALGMVVKGQAQVSMNFTDTQETPLFPVIEAIRDAARDEGVDITHSELIGLVSNKVLVDVAQAYLKLESFSSDRVLEYQLANRYGTSIFLE